jgi:glutamate/tyrosine decarboxylase-like PLP-dependent enzyme
MSERGESFVQQLEIVTKHVAERYNDLGTLPTLPTQESIAHAVRSLPVTLPDTGLGTAGTTSYLFDNLLPGLLQGQPGPRYFGFVTGGVTDSAQLADILTGSYDENVQMTLPGATASTAVEARTLELVLDLLNIPRENYLGRTITTGATASNVLGLGKPRSGHVQSDWLTAACARDHLYSVSPHLPEGYSFAQDGPPSAPGLPSPPIHILALHPHFSITKAAGLVGLGAGPRVVKAIPALADDELSFDVVALETRLKEEQQVGRGVIVSYGFGEVNTGGLGSDLDKVSALCRSYGAWLHIDAGELDSLSSLNKR